MNRKGYLYVVCSKDPKHKQVSYRGIMLDKKLMASLWPFSAKDRCVCIPPG
jgi:hypothetical protein